MRRVAVVAVVVIAAAVVAYLRFFTPDSPAPVRLTLTANPPDDLDDLAGRWEVSGGSEAGYRIREKLARLPAKSDAVGRTSGVTGSVLIERVGDEVRLSEFRFEADLSTLKSDEQRRDRTLRTQGLQTDAYDSAIFASQDVIRVPRAALRGPVYLTKVTGELSLHGVTRRVDIPVQATFDGKRIEVTSSVPIDLANWSIAPPNIAGLVTVEPRGEMEVHLFLERP